MSNVMQKIVVIGASSAIAEKCVRLWVKQAPADIVLVGRSIYKIESIAADLKVRSPESTIKSIEADFNDPLKIQALVDAIVSDAAVNIVLIAHGSLPEQQRCQQDLSLCQQALDINAISPVLFAEAFAGHMEKANTGTLAIISSVAGDRGRKSNYVYGAAKSLVTRYAQGLQHRFAGTEVKVVLIKPGPTDTPMTAHLKQQNKDLADADAVAGKIVQAVNRGRRLVYAPPKWSLIMMVIRHLPECIFKRMDI